MRGVVFCGAPAGSGGSEYGWYHVLSEEDGLLRPRELEAVRNLLGRLLVKAAVYTEGFTNTGVCVPKKPKGARMGKGKGAAVGRFIVSSRGGPSFGL